MLWCSISTMLRQDCLNTDHICHWYGWEEVVVKEEEQKEEENEREEELYLHVVSWYQSIQHRCRNVEG